MALKASSKDKIILRELDGGLLVRRSTAADAGALADFNARIHSDDGPDQPDERLAAWTSDLLTRPHPSFAAGDFTIVEETSSGKIVSSLNLISQTWSYAGIEFKIGRPELVGTDPDYRNRGLVRAQFEIIHRWSAERQESLQAITGIPYYYRLFGYEMALNLGGGRMGYLPNLLKLGEGEQEPYRIRPAGGGDVELISRLYDLGCRRSLVSCVRGQAEWLYELDGMSELNINRVELCIIESQAGEAAGFLAHPFFNWEKGTLLAAVLYELLPGISWAAVTPCVVRYLRAKGESNARGMRKEPFGAFGFWLGESHPVYQVLNDRLPRVRKPYAWYLRVVDLPAFLKKLRPVLQARLSESPYCGHTGELKLTFYSRGLRLVFNRGQISTVEAWTPSPLGHSGDAAFPGLTFLQLLFGYRSLGELQAAFADCWCDSDDAYGLLEALFPRQVSNVWPVA